MTAAVPDVRGGRRARARGTRQRIVEAAYRLMASRGYAETTMADVASAAGVAVQTIYFTFRNKPGLLRAVWAFAVHGDHEARPPVERPWFHAVQQEPDLERALALAADGCLAIQKRVAPLASVFQTFSYDPEIVEFQRTDRELRAAGFRRLVDVLGQKRKLRPEITADDAVAILMFLLVGDGYRTMVLDLGWDDDKWRSWTVRAAAATIFESPP